MRFGAEMLEPVVAVGFSAGELPIAEAQHCDTFEDAQGLLANAQGGICVVNAALVRGRSLPIEALRLLASTAPLVLVGAGASVRERALFDLCVPELPASAFDDALGEATARWQRASEERLLSTIDGVGQVSGGTAHDLNNVLTVILGNLELIGFSVTDASQRELLEAVDAAAEKATAMARRLGGFSNRPEAPRRVRLNDLARKAAAVIEQNRGQGVELHLRLSDSVDEWEPLLRADRVGGILMNLADNALEAMADGGRIVIETSRDPIPTEGPGCRVLGDVVPARYLRVSVRDRGDGMTPEVLARCDELFFSGRKSGRAAGIGLSCARAYAAGEGGTLVIESAPGQGTSVHLLFAQDGPGTRT